MEERKLKEICELIVDCPHSTAKNEGDGYPLIRTPNVGKGRLLLQGVHRVNEEVYNARNERAVPSEGDIILAREAPVGNAAIIMPGHKVCLGQRVVLIRANKSMVNPMFLVYYLLSDEIQHRLNNNANGAVVAHLNMEEIRNLKVSIPDIRIQNSIAGILSSLDDKIECNRQINDNLLKQARALYKSWFVDFEPFKNGEFEESELGFIPKGWNVYEFGRVLSPVNEKVGDRVVTEYSVGNTGIRSRSDIYHKAICSNPEKNRIIRRGDLVFGMGNDRVTWGIMKDEIGATSPAYPAYKIDENIDYIYFEFFFKHYYAQAKDLIRASVRQGQTIDKGALMQKKIYMPPKNVWDRFLHIHNPIIEISRCIEIESDRLSDLRDILLPRLMSGELKVSEMNA